ncbi:AI-2E family transporter [Paraburkholderia sp. GAS334]|jgi:hypothetical protein|uniref:AI-2E family transporter n=1 Tax=Paraburkholderia sp. GAS334 TaxID=3035131 RepID=UPI003D1E3222
MTPNPPRWPATKVAPTDAPHLRALTSLVTSVVVIFALDLERVVLVPITLAVLLSFLAAPLVDLLRRLKQGQLPSVVVAVLLALTLIAGVGTLLGAQIAQLATEAPQYQAAIEKKIERVQESTVGRADAFLETASNALKRLSRPTRANGGGSPVSAQPAEKAPMPVEVHEPPASPISLAQQFLSPVVNPLETTGIVLAVATCIEKLEFIDVLFGDRPPLTPPTNFYQRILADDPEEAL